MDSCFPPSGFLLLGLVAAASVVAAVGIVVVGAVLEKHKLRWPAGQVALGAAGLELEPGLAVASGVVGGRAVGSYTKPRWTPCRVVEAGIVADIAAAVDIVVAAVAAVARIRLAASGASGASEASGEPGGFASASVPEELDPVPDTEVPVQSFVV